jgi:hypothetical protein
MASDANISIQAEPSDWTFPTAEPPHHITVKEAIELAKAGVVMNYNDIKDTLRCEPDYPAPAQAYQVGTSEYLVRELADRMTRPMKRKGEAHGFFYQWPPEPFTHISAAETKDGIITVFAVANGEALTFTDDAVLYPSDKLITQLRLLEK